MHKHTHTHKLKTAAIRVNICNIHNQLGAETMNEPSQTCLRQHEWNETIVLNIMNYTLSAYLHMARLLTENRFSIDDAHRNRLITKWRLGWPAITPTIMLFEKGSRTFCQTCANKLCMNLIRRAKHSFVFEYDSWKLWRDDPQHYVYASRSIPNEKKISISNDHAVYARTTEERANMTMLLLTVCCLSRSSSFGGASSSMDLLTLAVAVTTSQRSTRISSSKKPNKRLLRDTQLNQLRVCVHCV